jgi:rhodanese-related sulfurtransferase
MSIAASETVIDVLPHEAWDGLKTNPNTMLVDVRTQPEWAFVGVPDVANLDRLAIFSEWLSYPGMSRNPTFIEGLMPEIEAKNIGTVYFLCRSGVRSLHAAIAIADACREKGLQVECVNVAEGFEGDLDKGGHRGSVGGWKARGLAWRQS